MLGMLLVQKNQVEEAIKAFSEVLKLNPRAVAAQLQLSRLQLAKGEPAPAVEYAEQAVAGEPGNPIARLMPWRGRCWPGRHRRARRPS